MYYILYALLFTISLLPLRVLYFLSDGMYALIYYIIGYRKKVVMHNLNITFPEKSEKEKIPTYRLVSVMVNTETSAIGK